MTSVEMPGITLYHLLHELNKTWKGGYIQQLRQVEHDTFLLKLRTKERTGELLIRFPHTIIETNRKWKPAETQPGIVKQTKKIIENARIEKIVLIGMDRILDVQCQDLHIIIELFSQGNMILTDADYKIIEVYRAKEWKTRILKKGNRYEPPPGPEAWEKMVNMPLWEKNNTLGSWLVSQVGIPGPWTKEVCEKIECNPAQTTPLSNEKWKKLQALLQKTMKETNDFQLVEWKNKQIVIPSIGLKAEGKILFSGEWNKIQETIENRPMQDNHTVTTESKKAKEWNALEINKIRQQRMKEEWNAYADELKKKGEWIYTHFEHVEKLLDEIKRVKNNTNAIKKIDELPFIKKIDTKKGIVEIETEK
ncbi:MAG: NFACT family protein [Candidatus Diapherotrites archaeon]